jgi:hypothetical protein
VIWARASEGYSWGREARVRSRERIGYDDIFTGWFTLLSMPIDVSCRRLWGRYTAGTWRL